MNLYRIGRRKGVSDEMFDIGADLQRAYDDGYKCGRLDALAELLKYIGEMGDYEANDRKTEPQTESE